MDTVLDAWTRVDYVGPMNNTTTKVGDIVVQGGKRYRVEMVGDPAHDYPEMRYTYGVPVDRAGRPTSMREVRLTDGN